MRYDFTKVQERIEHRGLKFVGLEKLTGLDNSTIRKALKRGTADQDTALALTKALGIPYKDILIKKESAA